MVLIQPSGTSQRHRSGDRLHSAPYPKAAAAMVVHTLTASPYPGKNDGFSIRDHALFDDPVTVLADLNVARASRFSSTNTIALQNQREDRAAGTRGIDPSRMASHLSRIDYDLAALRAQRPFERAPSPLARGARLTLFRYSYRKIRGRSPGRPAAYYRALYGYNRTV